MKLIQRDDVARRVANGEVREYYLTDLLELIRTELPAKYAQEPHRHREVAEAYLVVRGQIEFVEGEDRVVAGPGDFVLIPPGERYHSVKNLSDASSEILTFKTVPSAISGPAVFARDKETLATD